MPPFQFSNPYQRIVEVGWGIARCLYIETGVIGSAFAESVDEEGVIKPEKEFHNSSNDELYATWVKNPLAVPPTEYEPITELVEANEPAAGVFTEKFRRMLRGFHGWSWRVPEFPVGFLYIGTSAGVRVDPEDEESDLVARIRIRMQPLEEPANYLLYVANCKADRDSFPDHFAVQEYTAAATAEVVWNITQDTVEIN